MRRLAFYSLLLAGWLSIVACQPDQPPAIHQPVFQDVSFQQDYSKKYTATDSTVVLNQVRTDRNGVVQILSSQGLLHPYAGEFLYPGTLVADRSFRPLRDKKIRAIGTYRQQLVYLDDKAVFSNAWAGKLYKKHTLPDAILFTGGKDFSFLVSDGTKLQYLDDRGIGWEGSAPAGLIDMVYDGHRNAFILLSPSGISVFAVAEHTVKNVYTGTGLTCLALTNGANDLVIGTHAGYLTLDAGSGRQRGTWQGKLPCADLTAVKEMNGRLWFGSVRGAFMVRPDGKFNYYASKRWLPSDRVIDLALKADSSILVLTDKGLGEICFKSMTLADKAAYFGKQVRSRHIRHGFNAQLENLDEGNLGTGTLDDSDNDGLWTCMYLAAEVFRHTVTGADDALENCRESMDALERLYTINPMHGFPSRSFERRGYKYDSEPWRRAEDPEWDWKSTTSSDEAIGHMFVYGVMAELMRDEDLKKRAVVLMDSLMQHVLDNNMYLVDWDGKPTTWGKWNPEYVNARPVMVGDRKINSSNIISMLQTAYHFTHKEVYKEKAFELMTRHGYYENLMRPMREITKAPASADDWSKMLSEAWNHSDDEMYFLGYWGLYRYAFNDTLRTNFREAIVDHWQAERPEKDGAWNIMTAVTGTQQFDLDEAVWYLQEYPLDLVSWDVKNSDRGDIVKIDTNFRKQYTAEVLPPDELGISRHNANRFELDGGNGGASEYSAGDIWLLPYWMGRYLGVISAPNMIKR
ncbi:ligand-binding sensor domain-containing protein [Parachryseolinea silvisoli]|uniref:hypothetical protein n=1 Tax=Parachryseolinea silvisoli TaxID=2873601 RepID=UPI002265C377|nr:hypothetical protein [Parachryseolinea silvisoli]MCD9019699.1 hypothetical protein [Parachryseolinea silvisoli]